MPNCLNPEDGYRLSIQLGLKALHSLSGELSFATAPAADTLPALKTALSDCEAVVVGAGAGLSTAAGFTYSGARFERYFSDFKARFGIEDIYSGGFYPFPSAGIRWAWWARHIYFNRYVTAPVNVYPTLRALLEGRDYFVITTNVDHQFQKSDFAKERLFYTQGDYGLFQSVNPAIRQTFDNEEWTMQAMAAQGFVRNSQGVFDLPENTAVSMELPENLLPHCPLDGSEVTMNLRADESFVEDEGWQRASAAYANFLTAHRRSRVLYLELGVGANTPVIIKYPFWALTLANPLATYACLNLKDAFAPQELAARSLCLEGDVAQIIAQLTASS